MESKKAAFSAAAASGLPACAWAGGCRPELRLWSCPDSRVPRGTGRRLDPEGRGSAARSAAFTASEAPRSRMDPLMKARVSSFPPSFCVGTPCGQVEWDCGRELRGSQANEGTQAGRIRASPMAVQGRSCARWRPLQSAAFLTGCTSCYRIVLSMENALADRGRMPRVPSLMTGLRPFAWMSDAGGRLYCGDHRRPRPFRHPASGPGGLPGQHSGAVRVGGRVGPGGKRRFPGRRSWPRRGRPRSPSRSRYGCEASTSSRRGSPTARESPRRKCRRSTIRCLRTTTGWCGG